jgi:hypothetical protein
MASIYMSLNPLDKPLARTLSIFPPIYPSISIDFDVIPPPFQLGKSGGNSIIDPLA